MENKKDITSYIKGYEFKREYNNERLHTKNLYNGIYMVGDYSATKLINESIEANIYSVEEEINTLSAIFNQSCDLQAFLTGHKEKLETISKKSLIEEFTLEETVKDSNTIINITPSTFDSTILYSGEGYNSLELLKQRCSEKISILMRKRDELFVLHNKVNDALIDDDYLVCDNEIKEDFINSYTKLNCDRLENYCKNPIIINNKEIILKTLKTCEYNTSLTKYRGNYSSYIVKHFDGDIYIDYCYILEVYNQICKNSLKNEG